MQAKITFTRDRTTGLYTATCSGCGSQASARLQDMVRRFLNSHRRALAPGVTIKLAAGDIHALCSRCNVEASTTQCNMLMREAQGDSHLAVLLQGIP